MKKFLAVICSLAVLAGGVAMFAGCSGGKTIPYPNPGGDDAYVIKIGVTLYEPMDYKDENGKWIGFDAELAEKAFKELGYDVSFVEIVWDNKIMSLDSGEIDCVWNGMTITDELQDKIALTDPYLTNQQVVVVRKGDEDTYKTTADLSKAKKIAFEGGSAAETELEKLNLASDKLVDMDKQLDTFLEVKTGSSDIAVVDKTMAMSICGQGNYTDLAYVEVGFDPENFAVGFRKSDSEMAGRINELLDKYAEDGTIARLKDKYGITL